MIGPMPGSAVSKQELFERLAAGLAAKLAVVTPNRRLAQALAREFDAGQADKGLPVWESADILPLSALVERLYEDALYSELAPALPLLLSEAQEVELWEQVIRASPWGGELLDPARAATQAMHAWRLAHGWRIAGALGSFPGNEDAQAFARWAAAYARHDSTDAARLPDVVAPLLGNAALRTPKLLVAYGFDLITPQEREFLDACAAQGVEVKYCAQEKTGSAPRRLVFQSARQELEAAADGRARGSRPGAKRVGVVVPELAARRREVLRVFARSMNPAHALPGSEARALPFNVSLGEPLSDTPLAHAALSILALALGEVPFEAASRLLRSPFLGGGEQEMAARARLDAALRRSAPARVTLGKLVGLVEGCPLLRRQLEAMFSIARLETGSPQQWGEHFTRLLEAAGFPGPRPRFGRVPGARENQRDAGRVRQARARRAEDERAARLVPLRAPVPRHAVPARVARGAGAGAGRARVGRPFVRRAVARRHERRGLAARRAPEPLPAARAAEKGRHPRGLGRTNARARQAHHRGLARRRAGGGGLAPGARGRPRADGLAARVAYRDRAAAGAGRAALARADLRRARDRIRARRAGAGARDQDPARRHAHPRRPGGVPVSRLRAPPARRRGAGGAGSPGRTRARAARCCTR